MSQNSTVIPNSNGLTFRTNLNNALDTLGTLKSGAAAPSSPSAGWFWFDTVNDKLNVRNAANLRWTPVLQADFVGTNIQHSIRNSSTWIYGEDGSVTGALQIKINGLYAQTLSGGMNISIGQNNTTDGTWVDYELYIAGNWSSADHTWHNVKAVMKNSTSASIINVRFCSNASDVFIVLGDTASVWTYPRMVIKDMVSNAVISGYSPDFTITRVTSYPTTIHSTMAISAVNIASDIHSATNKSTPVDADEFGIWDSVSTLLNRVSWGNIKATMKSYFDAIYATLSSPALSGVPTAPTAPAGTANSQIATTSFTHTALTNAFIGANSSIGANGYQKLPSGLIMQWGRSSIGSNQGATTTVWLPVPFPTDFLSVSHMYTNGSAGAANTLMANTITLSYFIVTNQDLNDYGTGTEFRWFAIGY